MDSGRGIQVVVEDDEVVVTKPGTSFLLAYRKSVDFPLIVYQPSPGFEPLPAIANVIPPKNGKK